MKNKTPNSTVWIIAYIDAGQLQNKDGTSKVEKELRKYEIYNKIEAFIPTIKILTKTFKKEEHFTEIPLLFNYGFFSVPRELAIYRNFLDEMQKNISCIFAWVKDTAKKIVNPDATYIGVFNAKDKTYKAPKIALVTDYQIPVAVATSDEIAKLIKDSFRMTAHSSEDLNLLKPGELITLRGYPWEGIQAQILSIDEHRKKVMVEIEIFNAKKAMEVDFDNVFFSIYHNDAYDDSLSTLASIDQMANTNQWDRFNFKMNTNENVNKP